MVKLLKKFLLIACLGVNFLQANNDKKEDAMKAYKDHYYMREALVDLKNNSFFKDVFAGIEIDDEFVAYMLGTNNGLLNALGYKKRVASLSKGGRWDLIKMALSTSAIMSIGLFNRKVTSFSDNRTLDSLISLLFDSSFNLNLLKEEF